MSTQEEKSSWSVNQPEDSPLWHMQAPTRRRSWPLSTSREEKAAWHPLKSVMKSDSSTRWGVSERPLRGRPFGSIRNRTTILSPGYPGKFLKHTRAKGERGGSSPSPRSLATVFSQKQQRP